MNCLYAIEAGDKPRLWRRTSSTNDRLRAFGRRVALLALMLVLCGCKLWRTAAEPSIEFSRVPPAEDGASDKLDVIQGTVIGGHAGQQIILYARSGQWWIQPITSEPFTKMGVNSTWINWTHLGTEYAALLVEPGYHPAATVSELPQQGGAVAAVASVKGAANGSAVSPTLPFSGYEWRLRNAPSDRGGVMNPYDPANVWTDANGWMHLRITKRGDKWACAEATLTRNLGYGTYSFRVQDTSALENAAVFSMFTFDYAGGDQNHREMAIELTRWGASESKNAQYVVQPFYIPANVARFTVPPGVLMHSFRWEPGRISFRTIRGSDSAAPARTISEHVFTSGVPNSAVETVRVNLYVFSAGSPLQKGAEVVIEKFDFLP